MFMTNHKILLVDDDRDLLEMLLSIFQRAGYTDLLTASSGSEALRIWREAQPNLIVLDVMMPGMDGFSVLKEIRRTSRVPVLMLTARGEAEDRIEGLEIGADDYLAKPYSLVELELRLRLRIGRRHGVETGGVLRFGTLEIDLDLREVRCNGTTAPFTALEFDLLAFLAQNPGQVFSYEQLYDHVWNSPMNRGLHNIQVCIARVRQKLDQLCPEERYIETVRRKGYLFRVDRRG